MSAGYPDWVTTTEQTDRDYASTGCAILYIYWMLSLGYSKAEVTQAGGATLADNYKTLTGKSTAYADLKAATQAVTVTSDNPFGIVEPCLMKRVARNADGRLEVFAQGTDNALWHIWQTAPNNGWSGWASLGGTITSEPEVARNADGRLEVFARGTDNALWHMWQTAPEQRLVRLGIAGRHHHQRSGHRDRRRRPHRGVRPGHRQGPVAHLADRAEQRVVRLGIAGRDHHQRAGSGAERRRPPRGIRPRHRPRAVAHLADRRQPGDLVGWASLGGIITSEPVIATDADGRIEVFARGTDNALWHIWQTAPSNGLVRLGITGRDHHQRSVRGPQRRRPP